METYKTWEKHHCFNNIKSKIKLKKLWVVINAQSSEMSWYIVILNLKQGFFFKKKINNFL